jgi:hypothetical protein
MLVAVIMIFVVLSFTGVAVLDISYNSRTSSIETVDNIKTQFVIESSINEALWLINTGADSLVNSTEDGVTIIWSAETNILTVAVDTFGVASTVSLDLTADTHFDRGLASNKEIKTNGHSFDLTDNHTNRKFDFMPEADLVYFEANAVNIENGNEMSWSVDDFTAEGIYVFNGNNLTVDGLNLANSTLIFTGSNINFINCTITAPLPVAGENALPAIVVTNTASNFTVASSNWVEGAVFCAGQVNLENATLTGPVVGDLINLNSNITFIDNDYDEYFTWAAGFGDVDSYDFPKQVGRWTTTEWGKSNG